MKRYTGNLVIELEDQNTGTIETVSETNMVTNAVNDILGVNPMGVMYKAGGQYDDSLTWNQELLPICPNMIGGILLFPSSITEQADNLYLLDPGRRHRHFVLKVSDVHLSLLVDNGYILGCPSRRLHR